MPWRNACVRGSTKPEQKSACICKWSGRRMRLRASAVALASADRWSPMVAACRGIASPIRLWQLRHTSVERVHVAGGSIKPELGDFRCGRRTLKKTWHVCNSAGSAPQHAGRSGSAHDDVLSKSVRSPQPNVSVSRLRSRKRAPVRDRGGANRLRQMPGRRSFSATLCVIAEFVRETRCATPAKMHAIRHCARAGLGPEQGEASACAIG